MWKGRAAGFPLGSKVCTCIWDGSFLRPTVIKPGETFSSMALPIVAAKLVLAAPCNGIFHVIMYSLTPLNWQLSIMYPRAIVPSALNVPRSDPDKIDVNARCLDNVDLAQLRPHFF